MQDLISFVQEHPKLRIDQALEALVAEQQQETESQNRLGDQGQGQGQMPHPNNPQINLPPNGVPANMPPGARTPGMANMQMPPNQQPNFSSPSVSNLNLPMQPNGQHPMNGSPHIPHNPNLGPNSHLTNSHTPSPAISHMAAPSMMPQHSQQGTNSSAASANTSPNVSGKRRRSTVKLEGDDGGGGEMNGTQANQRVKASPRVGQKKGK